MTTRHHILPSPAPDPADTEHRRATTAFVNALLKDEYFKTTDPALVSFAVHIAADHLSELHGTPVAWSRLDPEVFFQQVSASSRCLQPHIAVMIALVLARLYRWLAEQGLVDHVCATRVRSALEAHHPAFVGRAFLACATCVCQGEPPCEAVAPEPGPAAPHHRPRARTSGPERRRGRHVH